MWKTPIPYLMIAGMICIILAILTDQADAIPRLPDMAGKP